MIYSIVNNIFDVYIFIALASLTHDFFQLYDFRSHDQEKNEFFSNPRYKNTLYLFFNRLIEKRSIFY